MAPIVFAHAEITRFDKTLARLHEGTYVAGHKSIVRSGSLDMDFIMITRYGIPKGGTTGCSTAKHSGYAPSTVRISGDGRTKFPGSILECARHIPALGCSNANDEPAHLLIRT